MSTAMVWAMSKDIPPAPGDLLVRATTVDIGFILMGNIVIQLAWDGDAWITCWGHSGDDVHHVAVQETARHEHQGFTMLGPAFTARSHLSPEGLYKLVVRGTSVQLKELLPGEWLQIEEVS